MRASCPFPWLHLAGAAGAFAVATVWSGIGRKMLWQVRTSDSGREATGVSRNGENAQRWRRPGSSCHLPNRSALGTTRGTAAAGILALAASAGATAADCWNEGQEAYENRETRAAIRCLETLAAKGHIRAKLNLGILLRAQGRMLGEQSESDRGTSLVREAARAGHIVGFFVLANDAYEQAKPLSRASWTYWRELVQGYEGVGGIIRMLDRGTWLSDARHKYDGALFADDAANGDRDALLAMAIGYWLKRDRHEVTNEQVIAAFEQAAKHGDERAAYALGWMYAKGEIVRKDREKAKEFRKQARNAGYPHAFRRAAWGVFAKYRREASEIESQIKPSRLKWIREGKQGENPEIALTAAKDETSRRGREEAIKWLRQGHESGNPALLLDLGVRLSEGAGEGAQEERDREEGRRLIEAAAELGHPRAAERVAGWYATGDGVEQDEREAGRWYWRALAVYVSVYGPHVAERRLRHEHKELVLQLAHTTGERPQEYGFERWWY